ncbi:hypothetical protein E2C01_082533 [Portunus trituberculatus]|uniref:Uncharacterized protein n=1 Tax=Portunus trituberculatus TaxID=210409 RepID=A0A5B7IQ70_PORTR|nr:hypothetical protein [Portunus trituberculatus]
MVIRGILPVQDWRATLQGKLSSDQVGTKRWRNLVKEKQGESRGCTVPPFQRDDGAAAHTAKDKADLTKHFASKMSVPDPDKPPPTLLQTIKNK